MNINEIYATESKYLKAEHLPANNARVPVVIENWEIAKFEDGKKQVLLKFEGKEKMLGLNKTNATTIEGLIGTGDVDSWIGYKIKLYRTKVNFQDKMVDAVRVDDSFCEDPRGQSTIKHMESESVPF